MFILSKPLLGGY